MHYVEKKPGGDDILHICYSSHSLTINNTGAILLSLNRTRIVQYITRVWKAKECQSVSQLASVEGLRNSLARRAS